MKLTQDIKTHLDHYLILAGGLILVLFFFVINSGNESWRQVVILSAAILYVVWGVTHHEREGDLHLSIVLEYIFTALLAVVFIFGVMTNL